MRRAKTIARQAVRVAGAALDSVRRPPRGVNILIYHRVGAISDLEVDLPTSLFRSQMQALAASGRVVTLQQALDQLRAGSVPEEDPVVVTFDDGTADVVDVAVPILAETGIPALLYLSTAFVEEGKPFPADGKPVSWAALADAMDSGVLTVGSHTHDHRLLDRVGEGEAVEQLDRSVSLIGERLGVQADHFAYPKAVPPNAIAEVAVKQRFRSAALAGGGSNPYQTTDVYRLARSPIQRSDGMGWFLRKAGGGLSLESRLRDLASRSRYARAVD
jgi:peptidoglycan/xylan/chitin deacetylase (PgdA/CDA1 family)